ncbi:MAG: membrane dipeptidase [Caldilineaceae bacterium]|nr:membrane dipeptidase [Caldilineaceae bacterium]
MLIIDAHLDLSMNALQWNRDLIASVYTIRTREQRMSGKGRAGGTVAFPEMRQGRIALSFATVLSRSTGTTVPYYDFDSPTQAHGMARGQLAYYHALQRMGLIRMIEDATGLDDLWGDWERWEASGAAPGQEPPLGFVLSMEGADPILDPAQLEEWTDLGLRALGLTHYGPGRYAGGTGTEKGLTDLGRAILPEMERLGVLCDLTHMSDQAFWQALEIYNGPVLASHNNCRALVPHQRQFSDDQIRAIAERDGVIGAAMDIWMVVPGWTFADAGKRNVFLSQVIDHIDHVCKITGSTRHIAIGTDLDGGFGLEQSPADLDTIADLQKIPDLLRQRGYGEEDIAAICHGNWLRLLRETWAGR